MEKNNGTIVYYSPAPVLLIRKRYAEIKRTFI